MRNFIVYCAALAGVLLLAAPAVSAGLNVNVQQPDGNKQPVQLYSNSYALVIGIDDYRSGWPRLSNAVRDAREVKGALERHGFEVTLLTNLKRAELIEAMRQFFIVKGEDPDARLMLWFAGHGHTENNEGFLIPADGAPPEAGARFRLSAIPMRDVSTYVRLAISKHVLSVFDSCFSGTIFDTSRSAPSKAITQAATRPVRQFLTSGDAFQQVSDDGAFRELFIRALDGSEDADLNRDGYVTGMELGFYISDRMTNLTQGRQTPSYGKLRDRNFDLGDYVFAAYQPTVPTAKVKEAVQPQVNSDAIEMTFWQSAVSANTARAYQAYLNKYPSGFFAPLAQERIAALSSQRSSETQVAALPPAATEMSSRDSGKWLMAAKIKGTTTCRRIPSDFETVVELVNGRFSANIPSDRNNEIMIAGIIQGPALVLDGDFGARYNGPDPKSHDWRFSTTISGRENGGYRGNFRTGSGSFGCVLKVAFTLQPA